MALDTRLVSVDRSVPVSTGKRGCRPSQAPHLPVPAAARGPPLPYLEQHSESSVGFSHLGRETGEGGTG